VVAGAIPPLWFEIALLDYRGSFQSRLMWAPVPCSRYKHQGLWK
jgi:hypothetical protein